MSAPAENQIPHQLVIVKLGGSCITDKTNFESLKPDVISAVAQQVQTVFAKSLNRVYIAIVHGAGSYGHFQARQFAIKQGGYNDTWAEGFAATRLSVTRLNHYVVSACVEAKLPAVGMSPFPHIHVSPGDCYELEPDGVALAKVVAENLRWGLVPVLHGDAVLSAAPNRCTILSGDTLVLWLARHLPAELGVPKTQCVFLTDVAGVYREYNPLTKTATGLINLISVQPDGGLLLSEDITGMKSYDGTRPDVTGGLKSKIEAAAAIATLGVPVYIVEACTISSFEALNGGIPTVGTAIAMERDI